MNCVSGSHRLYSLKNLASNSKNQDLIIYMIEHTRIYCTNLFVFTVVVCYLFVVIAYYCRACCYQHRATISNLTCNYC